MSEQNEEIEVRVKKVASIYNEVKMKRCENNGTQDCCAPFCDYCHIFKRVKPMRELVEEWRANSKKTRRSAEERGDIDAPKLSVATVCDTFDEFLKKMERSLNVYGDEAAQDAMLLKKGGCK